MADGKFYWLKLKRDFFKRHDIQIIEDMPNGKEYILFYLKLLCESVDHDGNLRFSEQIPYNENMLATITRTNVDIVRAAIQVFTGLNMMEIMDDGTYFMSEVHKMIGSAADNDNANRQRRFREKQKQLALPERYDSVTKNNESKSKSIELDTIKKENSIKERKTSKKFVPPTREQVREYVKERNSSVDADRFYDYFNEGNWVDSEGKPVLNWKQKLITWEKKAGKGKNANYPPQKKTFLDMYMEMEDE